MGMEFHFPGETYFNSWYPIIVAVVIGFFFGFRSYIRGPGCPSREGMKKKTVIITGANNGIGKETAKDLANRGARVILACRDEEKGKAALEEITTETKSKNVVLKKLDLASFESIKEFAEDINKNEKKVHVLINNAGVMCYSKLEKTEDGFELQFATNHLGPYLLTHLLLDKLKASAPSRIINTSALAHRLGEMRIDDINFEEREYKPGTAYAQSKLAVMLYTKQLAKELEGTNVTVNAMHPGVVNSDAQRHMPFRQSTFLSVSMAPVAWYFMKAPKDGAQTQIYLAVAKEEEGVSGKYFGDCAMIEPEDLAKDEEMAKKLWEYSMKACGLQKGKKSAKKSTS